MKEHKYPPGPKSKLPWSIYLELHHDVLGFMSRAAREYGDLVHLQLGPRHDYLVSSPDDIQKILLDPDEMQRSTPRALKQLLGNGLLTCQGEFHRKQRRLLQPAFHKQRISALGKIMTECAGELCSKWKEGETLDIGEEMIRLSLDIVVKSLLGSEIGTEKPEVFQACEVIKEMTSKKTIPFVDSFLRKLPLPQNLKFRWALGVLDETVYGLIRKHKADRKEGLDFLSMLLELQRSAEGDSSISDEQIRDEVMTMFAAGHETIGNALIWTWYLLSENPGSERKLHQELESVLGGRTPEADDLPKLTYLKMVLSESMRLYPPVWLMVRRPMRDYEVNGYWIKVGSYVHISQYVVHRDPRYFPDPERFDPDRWQEKEAAERPRYSYFPFGGGSRQCIGEGFAWTEGMLVIAAIAQKWRLRFVKGHPIKLEPQIALRSKYGMPMILEARSLKREYASSI